MSDTTTPRLVAFLEKWEYSPTPKALVEHAEQLERELAEAKAELENVKGFLNDEKRAHFKNVETERELKSALRAQLTDHKAALDKCEKALSATWADVDHLNHWMPTPCRELYMDAKLEIAKLKGPK